MKMNALKTILSIIVAIIMAIIMAITTMFVVVSMPWTLLMIGGQLSPNPPSPQIQHGEFPFRLEYEIDGQKFVVEDVLICDFDGFGFSEGSGEKFRKWKSKLKSGKTRITLLEVDGIEIYYPVAGAMYYMGDPDSILKGATMFPDAYRTSGDVRVNDYIISADEMWEKYKLRLVNWEISPPIENKFE